jgi:hypothetical protein
MVTKKVVADKPTPKKRVKKVKPEPELPLSEIPAETVDVLVSLPATEPATESHKEIVPEPCNDSILSPKYAYHWIFFITILFMVTFLGAYVAGFEQGIVVQNQNQTINGIAKTPIEYDRAQIMDTEKKLMGQIMDYQIQYGSNTISWSLNVNFR